jgi:hypothetical protein
MAQQAHLHPEDRVARNVLQAVSVCVILLKEGIVLLVLTRPSMVCILRQDVNIPIREDLE